jgi:hypothetical protein
LSIDPERVFGSGGKRKNRQPQQRAKTKFSKIVFQINMTAINITSHWSSFHLNFVSSI